MIRSSIKYSSLSVKEIYAYDNNYGRQGKQRIDKVLRETFPRLPNGALFKAFRKKDIKVNGVRVKEDHIVKLMTGLTYISLMKFWTACPKRENLIMKRHFRSPMKTAIF